MNPYDEYRDDRDYERSDQGSARGHVPTPRPGRPDDEYARDEWDRGSDWNPGNDWDRGGGRDRAGDRGTDWNRSEWPGGAEPVSPPRASGRAPVGRASVPGPVSPASPSYDDGYSDSGPLHDSGAIGATGRATVGRASVRPAGPSIAPPLPGGPGNGGGPGFGRPGNGGGPGFGGPGNGGGPGYGAPPIEPGIPSGPISPPGRGPWGPRPDRAPTSPSGPGGPRGPKGPDDDDSRSWRNWRPGGRRPQGKGKKSKKARRRNIIIASFAIFIMLTGLGVVGGTYYISDVKLPGELQLKSSTTVYFSDGTTVMAKLGDQRRYVLSDADLAKLPKSVEWAVISAEDRTFLTNPGIDFKGIIRAAWNNFTGGETQGASTITQQYARAAADLSDVSYARKLREAVIAWKLDDKYTKDQIMGFYLNTVYFGRQAWGIEAASLAYFNKSAKDLKPEEAMVLASVIKSPGDGTYDPALHPDSALQRWNYVRQGMIDANHLDASTGASMKYPTTWTKYDYQNPQGSSGLDKPTGLVVQHAISELRQGPFKDWSWDDIANGGWKIITTIDFKTQVAAENAADIRRASAPSEVRGQPKDWQAALVSVQPGTGRVLAYYGGSNGSGGDWAGWYIDKDNEPAGYGKHPPGSSMKVYTLAAALSKGVSIMSYWDASPEVTFVDAGREKPVRNASHCPTRLTTCSLLDSTIASLNTPFFGVTVKIGAASVVKMAKDAGIDDMWGDDAKRHDLTTWDEHSLLPFGNEVGIGQYGITVADHANGMATFAAGGNRAQEHFVAKVIIDGQVKYSETIKTNSVGLNPAQIQDLDYALSHVTAGHLDNGFDTASKTGTWQVADSSTDNNHVWTVGYMNQLATAVWVGTTDEKALVDKNGNHQTFGSSYAAPIWRQFMKGAIGTLNLKAQNNQFTDPSVFTGDPEAGNTPSPVPTGPPTGGPIDCYNNPDPILCPTGGPQSPTPTDSASTSPTNGGGKPSKSPSRPPSPSPSPGH